MESTAWLLVVFYCGGVYICSEHVYGYQGFVTKNPVTHPGTSDTGR